MGIFARLKMGWNLSVDSLTVLRKNPELALFPLISGIAGLLYIALLFGGAWVVGLFEREMAGYGVLFLLYLGSTFIASFFNAALVYSAREAFEGRNPSVKGGLGEAWRHKGTLFVWSVIAAIVGLIVRAIERQDNIAAKVVALLFSAAWSIITYFIIPVIVFEDVGVTGMFKRSGETFKNTWGETAGASFGIGIITILFMLVGVLLAAAVFVVVPGSAGILGALALGAVMLLVTFLFGSALTAIAKTALYVYATEGKRPPEFDNVDFEHGAR
jgi:hypothetical protein